MSERNIKLDKNTKHEPIEVNDTMHEGLYVTAIIKAPIGDSLKAGDKVRLACKRYKVSNGIYRVIEVAKEHKDHKKNGSVLVDLLQVSK